MSSLIRDIAPILDRDTWLIALDRDGTLVPIIDDPAEAVIQEGLRATILALAQEPGVHVALVSARGLPGLKNDLDPAYVILAGSYGLEISFPDGQEFIEPTASRVIPRLEALRRDIVALLPRNIGVILEDHRVSLCLHWHKVPRDKIALLDAVVRKLQSAYRDLYFKVMPTSYEIQPEVSWDKGSALREIERILQLDSANVAYVYAGDFDADEPAFSWVNRRGGASIKVGVSGSTAARFRLGNPQEVRRFLGELLIHRRAQSLSDYVSS